MDNNISEINKIQETITKVFVNSDQRAWTEVAGQFDAKVVLDYSSMTGNSAEETTPNNIVNNWKTVLPGFTHTHHQIGNFITSVNNNQAHSFCYGTATHYLENENGNLWTVVGTYDFDLVKKEDKWLIKSMRFNYKYQDGNAELISKAIENAKTSG